MGAASWEYIRASISQLHDLKLAFKILEIGVVCPHNCLGTIIDNCYKSIWGKIAKFYCFDLLVIWCDSLCITEHSEQKLIAFSIYSTLCLYSLISDSHCFVIQSIVGTFSLKNWLSLRYLLKSNGYFKAIRLWYVEHVLNLNHSLRFGKPKLVLWYLALDCSASGTIFYL